LAGCHHVAFCLSSGVTARARPTSMQAPVCGNTRRDKSIVACRRIANANAWQLVNSASSCRLCDVQTCRLAVGCGAREVALLLLDVHEVALSGRGRWLNHEAS